MSFGDYIRKNEIVLFTSAAAPTALPKCSVRPKQDCSYFGRMKFSLLARNLDYDYLAVLDLSAEFWQICYQERAADSVSAEIFRQIFSTR